MSTRTLYYQITEDKKKRPDGYWRAWTNCKDNSDQLLSMAVRKYLRDRGGFTEPALFVRVFWHWAEEGLKFTDFLIRK